MSKNTKLVRTIYLYVAALVSLIFVAVGSGTLLNTGMKYFLFPKAEKGGFNRCNQQPPVFSCADLKNSSQTSEEQKKQIDQMMNDYETWKKENIGEECYSSERQNNTVNAVTMIVIALPICLFHWSLIKKDKNNREQE